MDKRRVMELEAYSDWANSADRDLTGVSTRELPGRTLRCTFTYDPRTNEEFYTWEVCSPCTADEALEMLNS